MELAIKTPSHNMLNLAVEREKSRSESILLDDSTYTNIHYGSLGIFETPEIPGGQTCIPIISMNNSPQYTSSISSSSSYTYDHANMKISPFRLSISNHYSNDSADSSIFQSMLSMIDVTNSSISLAFLSLPYAIVIGGEWKAIIGLIFVMLINYHCCRIYTQLLNEGSVGSIPSLINPSYPQLVFILSDYKTTFAYYTIVVFSIFECIGVSCVYIVFIWENIQFLLSRFDDTNLIISEKNHEIITILLSIIMILPALLIIRLNKIYLLSYTTLISAIILILTVISFHIFGYNHYTEHTQHNNHNKDYIYAISNNKGFVTSIGIFLFCLNSNSYSPLSYIQSNLKNSKVFKHVLIYSHLCITIIYGVIGLLGALLYGKHTKPIIMENIIKQKIEPQHNKNIHMFADLLCIVFIICIWSSVLPLIIQISNFIESNVICEYLKNKQKHKINTQIAQNYSHQIMKNCLQQNNTKRNMVNDTCTHTPSWDEESETHLTINTFQPKQIQNTKTVILNNNTKRVCRIILLFIIFGIATMFNDNLIFFESILGICFSSITVIVFPYVLYLKYCWNSLSCFTKVINILFFLIIVILLTVLFVASIINVL
eukprot:54978_1